MPNILIADDEKEIVRLLKIYLEAAHFTIFEAYDGAAAYDLLRARASISPSLTS